MVRVTDCLATTVLVDWDLNTKAYHIFKSMNTFYRLDSYA